MITCNEQEYFFEYQKFHMSAQHMDTYKNSEKAIIENLKAITYFFEGFRDGELKSKVNYFSGQRVIFLGSDNRKIISPQWSSGPFVLACQQPHILQIHRTMCLQTAFTISNSLSAYSPQCAVGVDISTPYSEESWVASQFVLINYTVDFLKCASPNNKDWQYASDLISCVMKDITVSGVILCKCVQTVEHYVFRNF